MRVQLASDEAGSLGVEIDEDGTVVAFTHRGSEAETSGLPLGGQIVGVNGERVRGAAAIHGALEAGAPGPFDLEVQMPRIMRSTPPPQLPSTLPADEPSPVLSSDVPPPLPPSPPASPPPSIAGLAPDPAISAVERHRQTVRSTTIGWGSAMGGAWWDPGQHRATLTSAYGAHTAQVAVAQQRSRRHSSAEGGGSAPVGTRYRGVSSSSDSDSDDGYRDAPRTRRGRRTGPSRSNSLRAQSGRNRHDQAAQRRRQRHSRNPADRSRWSPHEEAMPMSAAALRTDSRYQGITSGMRKMSAGHDHDRGHDGDARGDWVVHEQQEQQRQQQQQQQQYQGHWQWEEEGKVGDRLSSPEIIRVHQEHRAQRSRPQSARSHGYSESNLAPNRESRYEHEDALPTNRRVLREAEPPAPIPSALRASTGPVTHGIARHVRVSGRPDAAPQPWQSSPASTQAFGAHLQHAGARRFTEEDELSESLDASRQAGPTLSFDDRSRVALGVDPRAAGYGRSGGARGGEHDRAPPPDWSRTHAGRAFPDRLQVDESG